MKRYPAGKIIHRAGWSEEGEAISLENHGVLYFEGDSDQTIFVPYSAIERIAYEKIPKEVLDAQRDDTVETGSK